MQAQQRLQLLPVLAAIPELVEPILSLLPLYELVTWGFGCRPFVGVESLRGLCSLRAVNTLTARAVEAFVASRLEQPVFSNPLTFRDFAFQCLQRTERLSMGFEDAVCHYCSQLYEPTGLLPHRAWHLASSMPYLSEDQVVAARSAFAVEFFKWFQFIPSDMRPRWLAHCLRNTDHASYINHHTQMYLRVPLEYLFLWPFQPYGYLPTGAEFPQLLYEFEFHRYRGITLTWPQSRRCIEHPYLY